MKTVKFLTLLILLAGFVFNRSFAQTSQTNVVVTINPPLDYGDPLGVIGGSYTYHITYHLTTDGYIDRLHWNIVDNNLYRINGQGKKDWVKLFDTGHDTYAVSWSFFNNPTSSNAEQGFPEIKYSVIDGWLDDVMPAEMPAEGACVAMSTKWILQGGTIVRWWFMIQFHLNANGELRGYVVKPPAPEV